MLRCLPQYWDTEQQHTWINSISSWDTSFLLYFWGKVFIISAVSGGPWCISQSGDLLPLECCEIEEVWDGSPADRRTSDTEIKKKTQLRGIVQGFKILFWVIIESSSYS